MCALTESFDQLLKRVKLQPVAHGIRRDVPSCLKEETNI